MTVPVITLTYLALLAGLFAMLSLIVVILRNKHRVPYGDGDITALHRAVRVHGNFAEWVPLTVMVIGGLELTGASASTLHWLLGALVIARIAHAVGLFQPLGTTLYRGGRIIGALTTWIVLVLASGLLIAAL